MESNYTLEWVAIYAHASTYIFWYISMKKGLKVKIYWKWQQYIARVFAFHYILTGIKSDIY